MSTFVTYKGQLNVGEQEKINLSTNDGLTGYRINKFQIISAAPGTGNHEYVGQIFLTDQTGSISAEVDFSNADLLGVAYYTDNSSSAGNPPGAIIIFDKETFNQNIFVNITDATGNTIACNYYIELEKFAIDINTSTFHTLKNIRSRTQI